MRRTLLFAVIFKVLTGTSLVCAQATQTPGSGDEDKEPAPKLDAITVEGKPWMYNRATRYSHSMPEVDGAMITVTKKTSVVKLDEQAPVINNNQRELFNRLPGIVIAEQQDPTQLNLSYRGIGNPQESEYVLVLQDGIPIALDWFGYPTAYYLPVPQTVDSIQMIRGGSGLLYGPQPQPVINYISRLPDPDHAVTGVTEQVLGSDGLFSSFNKITGTDGALGYLADFNYQQSDGQRENGDYDLNSGDVRLTYKLDADQDLRFDFLGYALDSGLPGFLTVQQFNANPDLTTTSADHLWTDRYTGTLRYDRRYGDTGLLTVKLWTGNTEVVHRTDTYPGGVPGRASKNDQEFKFTGLDARTVQRWGRGNAFTIGTTVYHSSSDWTVFDNLDPHAGQNDTSGTLSYDNHSTTDYGSLFAENVFRFEKFHLVPSARFEHQKIGTNEKFALASHTGPLVQGNLTRNVALFGIGIGNDFGKGNETYANLSQGYRPVRYRDIASNRSRLNANNDPDTTDYLTFEAGIHGWPSLGLFYDVSVFQVNSKNRIESQSDGRGGSTNVNSGDARNRGLEAEVDYDLLRLSGGQPSDQHLDLFFNISVLDAEITHSITLENAANPNGPTLAGNTPAYAPNHVIKAGLNWREQGRYSMSLTGQSTGEQYWADNNQARVAGNVVVAPAKIPSYTVFDFSGDYQLSHHLHLLAGVSNLLDEHYYSRVFFVNGGIEPAVGRSYHLGASYDFN